jgi:hypothetical protein
MHKPVRSQKKQTSNLAGTIRIAANIQKSIATGRSNYVEMRAASRMVAHNIRVRINSIKSLVGGCKSLELSTVYSIMSSGYEFTLTPDGILKRNDLEDLVSIDSDIAMLLMAIEDTLKINGQTHFDAELAHLKELLSKRKRLIELLKA